MAFEPNSRKFGNDLLQTKYVVLKTMYSDLRMNRYWPGGNDATPGNRLRFPVEKQPPQALQSIPILAFAPLKY